MPPGLPWAARTAARPAWRLGSAPLPPRLRPDARLRVMDATEWYGETSGGIRTYLLEKARYVAARPHLQQAIVVPGAHDAIEDSPGVRLLQLRGPAIPRHRPYRVMLATRSLARIIRHERPDLVEVGSPFLVPWLVRRATRGQGTPLVYYHHTDVARVVSGLVDGAVARRWTTDASWHYLRRISAMCAATVVATEGGAHELRAHGIENVVRLPLGVDLELFHPSRAAQRGAVRRALGVPEQSLVAVFAGRFAREKELDVVLDAWGAVEQACGARLLLVGTGPDEARLRAHRYGDRVLFRPFEHERSALAAVLAAADVYVAPGPAETFGLAAVEAMSCGLPVLSVERGAVGEHVRRSGAGVCYRTGSASDAARAARALFESDLPRLGTLGRQFAESEHGWSSVFDRLFALYQRVVAREMVC